MKLSFRHVFNIGVVLLMTFVVVKAMGYNRQSALLPLLIGVPVLILAVAQTVIDFRESMKKGGAKTKEEMMPPGEGEKQDKTVFAREVEVFLWVLAMFVSLYLFGFVLTTFLFTFLSLKVRSGYGWKISLGIATGCLAFLYIILISLLEVDLYKGLVVLALREAFLGY